MKNEAVAENRENPAFHSERAEHRHYAQIQDMLSRAIATGDTFLFVKELFDEELSRWWEEYDLPPELFQSFLRNLHLAHVTSNSKRVRKSLPGLVQSYRNGTSMVELAKKANYPPYLLARMLVEKLVTLSASGMPPKKVLTAIMRNPHKLHELFPHNNDNDAFERLVSQLQDVVASDPMYGPRSDLQRHLVGIEYEVLLEQQLKKKGLSFQSEADLRNRGTAKTPDFLLNYPVAVKTMDRAGNLVWRLVSWIDSKALFGDAQTHNTSVFAQAESYVHRFGPGLVLYWFGHAPWDLLNDADGQITIVGWELPSNMIDPAGRTVN